MRAVLGAVSSICRLRLTRKLVAFVPRIATQKPRATALAAASQKRRHRIPACLERVATLPREISGGLPTNTGQQPSFLHYPVRMLFLTPRMVSSKRHFSEACEGHTHNNTNTHTHKHPQSHTDRHTALPTARHISIHSNIQTNHIQTNWSTTWLNLATADTTADGSALILWLETALAKVPMTQPCPIPHTFVMDCATLAKYSTKSFPC